MVDEEAESASTANAAAAPQELLPANVSGPHSIDDSAARFEFDPPLPECWIPIAARHNLQAWQGHGASPVVRNGWTCQRTCQQKDSACHAPTMLNMHVVYDS